MCGVLCSDFKTFSYFYSDIYIFFLFFSVYIYYFFQISKKKIIIIKNKEEEEKKKKGKTKHYFSIEIANKIDQLKDLSNITLVSNKIYTSVNVWKLVLKREKERKKKKKTNSSESWDYTLNQDFLKKKKKINK